MNPSLPHSLVNVQHILRESGLDARTNCYPAMVFTFAEQALLLQGQRRHDATSYWKD